MIDRIELKKSFLTKQLFMNAISANFLPDDKDTNPLILYHGGQCSDGFAAALCAWLFFHGQGEYVPMNYGDSFPRVDNRAVYILDFSLPAADLLEIDARAKSVVLLDHHQTAAINLDNVELTNGFIHIDMAKSAARLAWEFFHFDQPAPALIRFVEDRDLWRWRYPETHAFTSHLDLEPMDFSHWSAITSMHGREFNEYVRLGQAMHSKFMHMAQIIAKDAKPVVVNSEEGLMVGAPAMFHNELGERLAQQSKTYALMWSIDGDHINVALRSKDDYNTLNMAHSMGGGGHKRASFFNLPMSALMDLIDGRVTGDHLLKSLPKDTDSLESNGCVNNTNMQLNKSVFHELWSAAAKLPHYDKSAWKSVQRQLVGAKMIN